MPTPTEIRVSDHAFLRYLQRALKMTPADMKRMILTAEEEARMLKMGSGKYRLQSGVNAVVQGTTIVTITINSNHIYKGPK